MHDKQPMGYISRTEKFSSCHRLNRLVADIKKSPSSRKLCHTKRTVVLAIQKSPLLSPMAKAMAYGYAIFSKGI